MMKQYGNSVRFRLLKWLHPLGMTVVMTLCWVMFCADSGLAEMSLAGQLLMGAGYLLALCYLDKVYSALTVGLVSVSELLYSQVLALCIGDAFFYVAAVLNSNVLLNPLPFLLALIVQVGVCVVWSVAANRIYYAHYTTPATAVIYRSEADRERIYSVRNFSDHFNVVKTIQLTESDEQDIFEELSGVQAVFAAGLGAELRGDIAKYCIANNIRAYYIPELSDIIMAGAEHMTTFSEPVVKVQRARTKTEYLAVKRLIDIVVSAIGLIVISPVMLVTAAAIKFGDGGPVFYQQKRLTQNGRVFSILKFRSMTVNAEKDGIARLASENDSRITPVGKIIRATRIDELPQLINILRGDMSLVGPRPERPEIAAEYEKTLPEFALRLQVKAGLTGVAQVYGRYNTDPYSKLQMDLMYINKVSLQTDLKLLFATVKILFMKESTEGIQEGNRTAMDKRDSAA